MWFTMCINKQLVQLPTSESSFVWDELHRSEWDGTSFRMAMAAAPRRISLDLIDKPPKCFCSKEDRAKERRAVSEAALSNVPGIGSSPPGTLITSHLAPEFVPCSNCSAVL